MEDNTMPETKQEVSLQPLGEVTSQADYTAKGSEFAFGGVILLLSVLMCNFTIYGGFELGFALAAVALIFCSAAYLRCSGHRFDWYSGSLLILSLVTAAGFARSDDGFVKYVMFHFLLIAVNLSLCLAAGQNRRSPNGATSLLDAPRALFRLGVGSMGKTGVGLTEGIRRGGAGTRRFGAVAVGLLISVPILAIMVGLLMDADAAFEGLMNLLPEGDTEEYLISAFWGFFLGWLLYSRGVALHRSFKPEQTRKERRGIYALTVNTVLLAVCALYGVYLVSQLAYLSGGFAGILPEGYTMAEYARRGFFEMAALCGINLTVICGSIWLIRRESGVPFLTKICGAFIGVITIFLVVTASAKMFMYIGSYGLTRLRVLTEVIMLWLGLTTVFVTVRLFLPRMAYMKAVVLTAMVMGVLVFWMDVDSLVAKYNVEAYQSGQLESVDMAHLTTLNLSAVPYIYRLTEDASPEVAQRAEEALVLFARWYPEIDDWRGWNWAYEHAYEVLRLYRSDGS